MSNEYIITYTGADCSFSQEKTVNTVNTIENLNNQTKTEEEMMKIDLIYSISTSIYNINSIIKHNSFKAKLIFMENLKNPMKTKENHINFIVKVSLITKIMSVYRIFYYKTQEKTRKSLVNWKENTRRLVENERISVEAYERILKKYQNRNSVLELGISKSTQEARKVERMIKSVESDLIQKQKAYNDVENEALALSIQVENEESACKSLEKEVKVNRNEESLGLLSQKYERLCNEVNKLKDEQVENEKVINLYIQEQNEVLDYQERRFKEALLEKRRKGNVNC